MFYYHVISDRPKKEGEHILLDETHPNGVHERVYAQMDMVEDIYRHPEKYEGKELTHLTTFSVARQFASVGRFRHWNGAGR